MCAVLLRYLFVGGWVSPGTHFQWALFGTLPFAAVTSAFETWPSPKRIRILGTFLTLVWLVFCLYRTGDSAFWAIIGWFLWCALITLQAYGPLTNAQKLRTISLTQTVTATVFTFGFFGYAIYGRIPASELGGEPTPATISFPVDGKPPNLVPDRRVSLRSAD